MKLEGTVETSRYGWPYYNLPVQDMSADCGDILADKCQLAHCVFAVDDRQPCNDSLLEFSRQRAERIKHDTG